MSEAYVVTNTELGWDCVIGVFKCEDVCKETLERLFPSQKCYVVHYPHKVHKDTIDFEEQEE